MTRWRRSRRHVASWHVALAVVTICGGVTTVDTIHAVASPKRISTVLSIEFSGLENKALANLLVRGPKFKDIVRHNEKVTLSRPGVYLLRPRKIAVAGGVEEPGITTRVVVKKGVTTHATAYYYFVPTTTLTIPAASTLKIIGSNTGRQVLILAPQAAPVKVGDILASGPTKSRPDGYLVKVASVTSNTASTSVSAVPATLEQAVPDGSLNLQQVLTEVNNVLGSGLANSPNIRPRAATPQLSTKSKYQLSCSGPGKIGVSPSLGFAFHGATSQFNWNWLKTNGNVSVNYTVTASLTLSASAAASCSANITLLNGEAGSFVIDVGIPIVLTPTYSLKLKGDASADGTYSQTIDEEVGVTMTAKVPPKFKSTVTPLTKTTSISNVLEGSVGLGLFASIGVKIDGVVGLSLDADPQLKFSVNSNASPWWTLKGCVSGGFSVAVLSKTVIDESSALNYCRQLAAATGGVPVIPTTPTTSTTILGSPMPTTTTSLPTTLVGPKNNILIYGDNDDPSIDPTSDTSGMGNIATALEAAGFNVTTMPGVTSLPTDISSYGQIWYYGVDPINAMDELTLENFVRMGGSIFISGEWGYATQWNNQGVQDIVGTLISTSISVSGDDDQTTPLSVNTTAIDNFSAASNALTTWTPSREGALTGVAPANVIAVDSNGNASGALWEVGNSGGRLAVMMDINWAQSPHEDSATMPAITQNLGYFLSQ